MQYLDQTADRIRLQGLRFFGYHGVLPFEKERGQFFEVNVDLFFPLLLAAKKDDLALTVDYRIVYQIIQNLVENERFNLIETLAVRIAETLLQQVYISGVWVQVRKPQLLFPGPVDWAGVEIYRERLTSQMEQSNLSGYMQQVTADTEFMVAEPKVSFAPAGVHAYVALGTNLGPREENFWQALGMLAADPKQQIIRVSSFYETLPVGGPPQENYLNAVAQIKTSQTPRDFLRTLQAIEQALGRERSAPNAPRTLDLDLLLFGEEQIFEPDLVVPHPSIQERDFVLLPLAEIAPNLVFPDGSKLQNILANSSNLATNVLSKKPGHVKMNPR